MTKNIQYRLLLIVALIAVCVGFYVTQGINLGLDLQGGIHLVVQVDTAAAYAAEVEQVRERITARFQEENVLFGEARVTDEQRILVMGVPSSLQSQAEDELDIVASDWTYARTVSGGTIDYLLTINAGARLQLLQQTVRQAREIITNRIDQYGVAEPTIVIYGSGEVQDQIIIELPGVDDFDRVINILLTAAKLELRLVHPQYAGQYPTQAAAVAALPGGLPDDYEVLPYSGRNLVEGQQAGYMVVRKAATITGQHLKNARRSEDPFTGRSEVTFFLTADGVQLFSDATGANVNGFLAVVLDGQIETAPRIESRINTESARITGSFSREEADDLALSLRSGALPAPIIILENRSVGPSLGRDSITSGINASLAGLSLVVVGMLIVYRLSGMNAILCLVLNLLFLVGMLAYFGATLTLPGIAGVILTIGMAVDANILIFERVKEELRLGKTVKSAVDAGFGRVFSTIIDTNTTTFIAALFLFQFGTGPIRGFAVTLAVGLAANIFTATFVSRTMFSLFLHNREVKQLSI